MDRMAQITDTEYWTCLCFQSREQAVAFARKAGIPADKYVDGRILAKKLKIDLG